MTWLDTQDATMIATAIEKMLAAPDEKRHAKFYANGDCRFELWLDLTSRVLVQLVGVTLFDLADCNLRDMFDDGYSPADAARRALEGDDTFMAMVGGL